MIRRIIKQFHPAVTAETGIFHFGLMQTPFITRNTENSFSFKGNTNKYPDKLYIPVKKNCN